MNLQRAETYSDTLPHPAPIIGLAAIARHGFAGNDLEPVRRALAKRAAEAQDVGALLDLSIVELILGRRENRLSFQARAIADQRIYRLAPAVETVEPLRLLAFMAPGDFMANTPVEFLLEGSSVRLDILYVLPGEPLPAFIPEHDIALIAIAESEPNRALLDALRETTQNWPVPVLNAPGLIAQLTRDGAYQLLHDIPGLSMPANARADHASLLAVAEGTQPLENIAPDLKYPIIVRPVGSHGGQDLEKIDARERLKTYLDRRPEAQFYIAPFIDYKNDDGLYRKYRIALIDGRAYGCHLAISRHWMVHYLNADMLNNPLNRAEEGRFLTQFETAFGQRHEAALKEIAARTGLDYSQIDCAETADGRLLLFEIGTAMIVHSMDPADVFPYKQDAMAKVFAAFIEMMRGKTQRQVERASA
ncbi:MAG: ATP-grasp domain-containing protein [Methylovirgula sp.]